MKYVLPELKYGFDALEPYIDKETMEIHYLKHHGTYVNNLNSALEKYPDILGIKIDELLCSLAIIPQDVYWSVRNNGGGHYNHSLFWESMTPGGIEPVGKVVDKIDKTFGNIQNFKDEFKKAALNRFGSGWVWLNKDNNGDLSISSTSNQDNPISEGLVPLLGLDLWEHAYYLKYQNKRADYITAWWNIVNWDIVNKRYKEKY